MPIFFHGTSRVYAIAMAGTAGTGGTIDVTRGRGEFGRGFYTQSSISNAYRRGQALYGSNQSVMLVLDIDDLAFHGLTIQRLTLNMAQTLNASLRNKNSQGTYTTTHDVIVGPLVTNSRIEQQKFQTVNAQTLLNGMQTHRTVI